MTLRMISRFVLLTAIALTSIACEKLADDSTDPPALATIRGTLSLADGAEVPNEQLRLALLWSNGEPYGSGTDDMGTCENAFSRTGGFTEQQIEIDANFPSEFSLRLTTPPPDEALIPTEEFGEPDHAEGILVAYADRNGNGKLDRRPDDAPSPDLLLASSAAVRYQMFTPGADHERAIAYYLEPATIGVAGTDYYFELPAGYSLARGIIGDDLSVRSQIDPIETPFDLVLDPTPPLQMHLCQYDCRIEADFECPATVEELPQPPEDAHAFIAGNTNAPSWHWSEGDTHTASIVTFCSNDTLFWNYEDCEGCTCETKTCMYDTGPACE